MLGRDPRFRLIEVSHIGGSPQERLVNGDLIIMIQVGIGCRDCLGKVLAKPGEVLFGATLGRRDHDSILAGETD